MRPTPLLAAALTVAGLPSIFRRLQQRHRWEQHQRQVFLALYYEQTSVAATRAGISHFDFLHECRHHGATHVGIREDTLDSLLQSGALIPRVGAPAGQHRFASNQPGLIGRLREEFRARLPHCLVERR